MKAALFAVALALLIAVELGAPTPEPFDNGSVATAAGRALASDAERIVLCRGRSL